MPYKSKEDQKVYYKKWESLNKDKRRKYNRSIKIRNKKFADRVVLKFGCQKCGYNRCTRALHFHHIDPKTKNDNVTNIVNDTSSLDRVKEEMRKCIILCANCHAETEYEIQM